MTAKICVITGANRGIGKEMALELATRKWCVVMVCRDNVQAKKVKEEIIYKTKNVNIHVVIADLSSIKDIIDAANQINRLYSRIDLLVNNVGVFRSEYYISQNGFEEQYAVNYFSVFALTNELLVLLNKSNDPKVINLGSNMHRLGMNPLPFQKKKKFYNGISAYANSKLAILLFTWQFAKRHQKISCYAFHPGTVKTEIGNKYSKGIFSYGWKFISQFFISPASSIRTGIYLATNDSLSGLSGNYFYKMKVVSPSNKARNKKLANKLWEESSIELNRIKQEIYV